MHKTVCKLIFLLLAHRARQYMHHIPITVILKQGRTSQNQKSLHPSETSSDLPCHSSLFCLAFKRKKTLHNDIENISFCFYQMYRKQTKSWRQKGITTAWFSVGLAWGLEKHRGQHLDSGFCTGQECKLQPHMQRWRQRSDGVFS